MIYPNRTLHSRIAVIKSFLNILKFWQLNKLLTKIFNLRCPHAESQITSHIANVQLSLNYFCCWSYWLLCCSFIVQLAAWEKRKDGKNNWENVWLTAPWKYVYATKFCCHGMFRMSMASPHRLPYTPRCCEGARSPSRLSSLRTMIPMTTNTKTFSMQILQ